MTFEQHCDHLIHHFNPSIPWSLFLGVCLLAIMSSIIVQKYRKKDGFRNVVPVWIIACVFMILYITVLGRFQWVRVVSEVSGSSGGMQVHLMPFWSILAIQDGKIEFLYEKIYNVLFFVPYGMLLGLRFSNGLRGLKCSILIGFQTSVTIELLQFITRTGTCETDDVICNTVGCGIGAVIGVGICWMIGKIKNK